MMLPLRLRNKRTINQTTFNALDVPRKIDERAYDADHPVDLPPKRKYRLSDFVAGKSHAPKENKPERLGVETIFPNVCFHFLNGHCVEGDGCLYSHRYPSSKYVTAKLYAIIWENPTKLFRAIVARCQGLLLVYFVDFARFFAKECQRASLIDMLAIYENPQNRMVPTLRKLMKAFVLSGLTYGQTIAVVLKNHRRKATMTLSIIFNTDIVRGTVNDTLKGLELLIADPEFDFDIATVNHLLALSSEIGWIPFVRTMLKILDRLELRCPSVLNGINQERSKNFMHIYKSCTSGGTQIGGRSRILAP